MASIFPRKNKDGSTSWRVQIRRKGIKSFITAFTSEKEAIDFIKENEEKYVLENQIFNFDFLKRKRLNSFFRKKQGEKMSKWIFSPVNKTFWNLEKVMKIKLQETQILLIYDEDGEQTVEFATQEDLMRAWDELWHKLSDSK